jgi:signal transduction histidine kinase
VRFEGRCHPGEVRLTVIDQGIGIPPEDLPRLFQAFHRGTNTGQRSGTGLGLVIVKRCVDLHGGTIHIASRPGEGTRVTVVLPLPAAGSSLDAFGRHV